ncbi:MAG: hypothetical protein HQL98_13825 [Magnetococcales bacterium]|nr:hypothetical protein [Magnetococcales bacterium]
MNVLPIRKPLKPEPAQHLEVLLTLAAGRSQEKPENCPAAASLAALVEGRLPAGQRTGLLEHLDQCSDCYRAWLGTAALQPPQSIGKLILFRRGFQRPALGALALAAGLMLVWISWDPFAPDLPDLLSRAYQTALLQGMPQNPNATLPLSGQEKTMALGFADADDPAPIRKAFVAGSQAGWDLMHQRTVQPPTLDPKWMVYHHLGRWTLLLQTLCQTSPPPPIDHMRQQAPLAQALGALLAKRETAGEAEARIPRREVAIIHQLLNTPPSAEPATRLCRQIQESCTTITEGLML